MNNSKPINQTINMNLIPRTIQEAVFMKVADSPAGQGPENWFDDQEIHSRGFDAQGRYVEKGLLTVTDGILVPFTAVYQFGKPRRAPKPKPEPKVGK